jgi:hypothetical protein
MSDGAVVYDYRRPECDGISAVTYWPHQHACSGRSAGIHAVLVLVSSGTLPRSGFHTNLSDCTKCPA